MSATSDSRTSEMVPLLAKLDHYSEAYRAYAVFPEKKVALYQRWAEDVFKPVAVDKLKESFSDVEELNVLGLGSGSGEVDACLLEQLVYNFPRITNTVIEPSSEMITRYTSLVQQRKAVLSGVTCHFLQSTIQEFRRELKRVEAGGGARKRFHFIHAVHSMCYATDLKGAILDLYESLEGGGVLMVIVSTDEHVICRTWSHFPFITSTQADVVTAISSRDIVRVLKELGIIFTSHTQTWRPEASSCFDPISDTGNMILDFVTHTVRFRDTAPVQLREKVLSFLRSICLTEECGSAATETSGENKISYFIRDWQSIFAVRKLLEPDSREQC